MPPGDSETVQFVDPTVITLGTDFGPRYRIDALLGQGGMGRVYKAYDKDLDRVVALKVVRQGMMGETDALKRFKQELILASKISHKNILRIHDMGEVNGMKFITMAFVEGQDLHQILQDNPKLPMERVLSFSQQLAEALAAAHSEGVIHRDLKPQNILVAKNDQIYVSDFGLAKSFDDSGANLGMTKTGAFLGTPRYMSPEQVEGKPADLRSDLYSYGLMLYEMVAGDVPFTGDSTLKVMYQRIQEKPKSPKIANPALPNWLVRIIMRCLEKDPADRYQNAYEILADLQGSKSGSTSMIGARTVQIQIPEFAQHRWTWWIAAAVLVLGLAFAIPPVRHLITGRGGGAGESGMSGIPPLSGGRFVSVLPLQVIGDASQLGYLAQGVGDALSSKLFNLKDIHVTASEEVSKIDQSQPIAKIARKLGANYLVMGTIQGSGDKIRVTLHLDNVLENKREWSQEFDGVTGDLFTLEDGMYAQLVTALNVNPTNEESAKATSRPTSNVGAYDVYLRGRNSLRGHDVKSIQAALNYFAQALQADPKFALAYAGTADASLRMYEATKDPLYTQKALAAAQQAETLNDSLPEVHNTLGSVYRATGKYAEAIAELNRAIALNPSSDDAYRRLGSVYIQSGNGAKAIEALQKAVQLNPYYWENLDHLGDAYYQLGDYGKALDAFKQVTVLEPDIDAGYENIATIYATQGQYAQSIPYYQKAIQIEPYFSTYSNLGSAYFFAKRYQDAADAFQHAVQLNPNDTQTVVNLADSFRALGQQDKATDTYKQSISLGFKELQTNPQDASVMAQIALSYSKTGDAAHAESFIGRARAIDKGNVNYIYAEAEINALAGHAPQAVASLREAFEKGYPAQLAADDPELQSLHQNPDYLALIKKYSTPAKH
ncbi:MAG: protein kinase [Candidatus Acidiferrales bacterium]